MATLTVRKLDDDLHERLRALARANNRSLEAEVRTILEQAAPPKRDFAEVMKELRAHHARMRAKYGVLSDSTPIIRQMRDEE